MARLESDKKGGYYPLERKYQELLWSKFEKNPNARYLEFGIGQGENAKFVQENLGYEIFGFEVAGEIGEGGNRVPHGKKAQELFGDSNVVIADDDNVRYSSRSFGVVYCNPPYSDDVIENKDKTSDWKGRRRLEYKALDIMKATTDGGWFVYVIYAQHMTAAIFNKLSSVFTLIIPVSLGSHLERYHQVAIICKYDESRPTASQPKWLENANREEYPHEHEQRLKEAAIKFVNAGKYPDKLMKNVSLIPDGYFKVPSKTSGNFFFEPKVMTREEMVKIAASANWEIPEKFLHNPESEIRGSAIHPVRLGQYAGLSAIGATNGATVKWLDEEWLLRGTVNRQQLIVSEEDNGEETQQTVHDRPDPRIRLLSRTGEIKDITKPDEFVQFMTENRDVLKSKISEAFDVRFDGKIRRLHGAIFDSMAVKSDPRYRLKNAQEAATTATVEQLLTKNRAILVGEMSTGKTAMTISAIAIMSVVERIKKLRPELVDEIAKAYNMKSSDLEGIRIAERLPDGSIKEGGIVLVACPSNLPLQWRDEIVGMWKLTATQAIDKLWQETGDLELLEDVRKLMPDVRVHVIDLNDSSNWVRDMRRADEAAKTSVNELQIVVCTLIQAKMGERIEHAYHKRVGASNFRRVFANDGGNQIVWDKSICCPVTGVRHEINFRGSGKPASLDLLRTGSSSNFAVVTGKEIIGYGEAVDEDGMPQQWNGTDSYLLKTGKYKVGAGRRIIEPKYRDIRRDNGLTAWQYTRNSKYDDSVSNGVAQYEEVEVKIAAKKIVSPKYKESWNSHKGKMEIKALQPVEVEKRAFKIKRRKFTKMLDGSKPVDKWLHTKGIRPTKKIVKAATIDRILKKNAWTKQYIIGDGLAEVDAILESQGLMSYTPGIQEVFRNPRWDLSDFIRLRMAGRIDLLVIDEVHRIKGMDTDAGIKLRNMIYRSKKTLALTGSIYGGVSSSLYAILFAFNPEVRRDFEWLGSYPKHWIEKLGVVETKITFKNENGSKGKGAYSNIDRKVGGAKEAPGISQAVLKYMLPYSIFVFLSDFKDGMPEFKQTPTSVQMSELQSAVYWQAVGILSGYNDKLIAQQNDFSFSARMYHTLYGKPDSMFREDDVWHEKKNDKGEVIKRQQVTVIPAIDEVTPKENLLLSRVTEYLNKSRRIIIHPNQTATRDIQDHLKSLIEEHDSRAKVFILRTSSTKNPAERGQYIQNKVDESYNVMICNPELVREGVNLIQFSYTAFIETNPSLYTMLQACRRTWRLPQPEPEVQVEYMYYDDDVYQSRQVYRVGAKFASNAILTGESDGGGLSDVQTTIESPDKMIKLFKEGKLKVSDEDIKTVFKDAQVSNDSYMESPWYGMERRSNERVVIDAKDFSEFVGEDDDSES